MELKLDDDGNAVLKDGKPVYVDGGKEIAFDAQAARDKIKEQAEDLDSLEKSTGAESKKLEKELKAYKRVGDLAEVKKAVQTVRGLEADDINAADLPGQLATITAERDALKEELDEKSDSLDGATKRLRTLTVGHAIASSAFSKDELIDGMTPDYIEQLWGDRFGTDDSDHVIPYDEKGKPMIVVDAKTQKPRAATMDEALAEIVPPAFRKPSGARGSDATNVRSKSRSATAKAQTKADLKTPEAKAEFITENGLEAFQSLPSGREAAA